MVVASVVVAVRGARLQNNGHGDSYVNRTILQRDWPKRRSVCFPLAVQGLFSGLRVEPDVERATSGLPKVRRPTDELIMLQDV